MHELALSESIVHTAVRACGGDKARVVAVGIDVGVLSAVAPATLEFCMRLVLDESGMTHTQVRISETPAVARCECGLDFEPGDAFAPCPQCGGFEREIVGGMDVTVRYVEVEDEEG